MDYHRFNIGWPEQGDINAWWDENLERGVITTGFDNQPGDRGEHHLKVLAKWDWVLAYVSGKGFVGAGKVKDGATYRLHEAPPSGTLSHHLHERGVVWKYVIRDVDRAIRYDEVDLRFPVGTRQRTDNRDAAKALIKRLREEGQDLRPTEVQYWWVRDAIQALGGGPCSLDEVEAWLEATHPNADHSDLIDNACVLTVNDANRSHHDRGRQDFRSDRDHPKDLLFRRGRYKDTRYFLYNRAEHGVWELQRNADGKMEAVLVEAPIGVAQAALDAARSHVYDEPLPEFISDQAAREWAMRAVAQREGQPAFKDGLLKAYGSRCAVTGCAVEALLDGAHIRPYCQGGAITNRMDNGLLLRTDIHLLFDRGLLWIDAEHRVQLAEALMASEYASLQGSELRLPEDSAHRPHPSHLAHHRITTAKQSA